MSSTEYLFSACSVHNMRDIMVIGPVPILPPQNFQSSATVRSCKVVMTQRVRARMGEAHAEAVMGTPRGCRSPDEVPDFT